MKLKTNNLLFIGQKQKLSQSLQHSLKILAMSNLELCEHINAQLNENPFLIEKHSYENNSDCLEKIQSKNTLLSEISKETSFFHFNSREKEITNILINNVSNNEYLCTELLEYVFREKNTNYSEVLSVIHKLKKTSFANVFAFNLQDKLKTFLENEKLYDNKCAILIKNLNTILSGNLSTIKDRYGFKNCELLRMISNFKKAFFSFPDYNSDDTSCRYIDLTVEERSEKEFEILIDKTILQKIEFDNNLYKKSLNRCSSNTDKIYVKNNALSAKSLIRSIDYRNLTMLRVTNEIAYMQQDFFIGKSSYLIPVSIKHLANALSLHESTISRAICNKSISTPRGIFKLKSLITKENQFCENKISDYSIKQYMKTLIDNEPQCNPYSDSYIVYFLNTQGINISRRAVSKYRNALNIPNISERGRIHKIINV